MDRSNSTYYINPSTIGITANANGNANDLSVNITDNAKIKVYTKDIPALDYVDSECQEWTIKGRNRRLADDGAYNIYFRLNKNSHDDGYLVFSQNEYILSAATTTAEGLPEAQTQNGRQNYWWIKIGTVSAAADNSRTADYDTGILGTDQYNNEWQLEPDRMPLRVGIANDMEDANPPYIEWGGQVTLTASLIRGWDKDENDIVLYWTITRDTGDAAADAAWNGTHSLNTDRQILLRHIFAGIDDFNAAVAATFTITAWGDSDSSSSDSSSSEEPVVLSSNSITILTETKEKYELELSAHSVNYNPATGQYTPSEDILCFVRSTRQNGAVSYINAAKFNAAGLCMYYGFVEDDSSSSDSSSSDSSSSASSSSDSSSSSGGETELEFTGDGKGSASLPISAFTAKKGLNVYLSNAAGVILSTATISFTQDGVDGEVYSIDTNIDSIYIPSGESSADWEMEGHFYRSNGSSDKELFRCAFIMCLRRIVAGEVVRTRIGYAFSVSGFDGFEGTVIPGDVIEIFLWRTKSDIDLTYQTYLFKKEIPAIADGEKGDSPYLADMDTDVAMLHTTGNGKPTRSQTISVIPSIRKGEDSVTVSLTGVKRNGTAMTKSGNTWTGQPGVTVIFSNGVISIAYTTAAQVASGGMDVFTFTLAHIVDGETLFSDDKKLTVTAFAQDQYSLLPSAEQIIVTKVGNTYDPATFTLTCGYRKIDIDNNVTKVANVLAQIDGIYNLYFRRHKRSTGTWESTYYLYSYYAQGQSDSSSSDSSSSNEPSYWLTNADVATYDGVDFILCKNTAYSMSEGAVTGLIYSAEIPVIQNGSVGATGPSYYYKGEWYDTENDEYIATGTQIQTTDYERPFVSYTYNGTTTYYLYIGAGVYEAPATRTSPASDTAHWTPMQSENKFIIADAIFADFAKFGSAVMNKDWMISANGRIDGVPFYVTDQVTGKMVDSQSSTWNTSAYVLFDNLNPKATSESKVYGFYNPVHELVPGGTWNIGTVNLTKDATYSVRTYAKVSAIGADVKVRVSRTGVGQTDVLHLYSESASGSYNSQAFFRVSEDGEYTVSMIAQNVGNVNNEIEVFEIAKVSFAPIYALDLYTGSSIQRDIYTSGFVRKDKTVINIRNVDEYTRNFADISVFVFEKCGSFIEVRDGLTVKPLFPLLYRKYTHIVNTQMSWDYWEYENKVYPENAGIDADYVRSLVGTKIIIYLPDGHVNGNEVTDWNNKILNMDGQQMDDQHRTDVNGTVRIATGSYSCNLADTFLRRIAHDDTSDYMTYEYEILRPGEFAEIECVSDTDCIDPNGYFDGGYEVIYWRVNKKGKMLP